MSLTAFARRRNRIYRRRYALGFSIVFALFLIWWLT